MQFKSIRRRCLIIAGLLLLSLAAHARGAYADPIRVVWDPNPVSESVIGYDVYIGTQSGIYTEEVDAGNALSYTFSDAVPGQIYYFALSAYNAGGTVGPLSTEASGSSNSPPVLIAPGNQTNIVGQVITPLQLMGSDPDGPVTYTATGLPPGLTLAGSTGLITGTGTTIGVFSVTATVLDNTVPPLTDAKIFTWTMAAPTVVLTPDPATLGTMLTAAVNGPGHPTDWVGLYPEAAPDNKFVGWCYLNGNRTAPVTGMTSATPTCLTPTTPGRYQVRLFINDGFTKVATSNTITVPAPPGPSVILTPDPATLGTTLTAAVSTGPGNQTDWLGLYTETGADTAFIGWCYLNGTRTPPVTGMTSATPTCVTPPTPGRYQVRLFANNTFTKVTTSNTITVPAPPIMSISGVTAAEGDSGTKNFVFTVSLAAASALPATVHYATADGTATAGSDYVATSGSLTFAAGVLSQTITVVVNGDTTFEPNETFSVVLSQPTNATLAVSTGIGTITNDDASTGPAIVLTPDPATLGTTLTAAVTGGPGNAKDWIALVPETAGDTAYVAWCYLNGAKTPPAAGVTSATPTCLMPTVPGRYQARLFADNGFTKVATSNTITVPVPAVPTVVLTPDPAAAGTMLTESVSVGPGNPTDWMGLFQQGSGDTAYVAWCYLNGAKTPPTAGMTSAVVACLAAPASGRYQVRLFSNNTFTKVATSNTITVP